MERVDALEQQVRELRHADQRVRAPLQVEDAAGRLILEVDAGDRGPVLRLFRTAGQTVTLLGALQDGGELSICHHEEPPIAALGSSHGNGILEIGTDDGLRTGVAATQGSDHLKALEELGEMSFNSASFPTAPTTR
jgi:hypothetical protein